MRSVDLEAMPRGEEKELFKDYMEEYNTGARVFGLVGGREGWSTGGCSRFTATGVCHCLAATLPHRKYYDLELYEKQAAAKAAKKGAKAVSASVRGGGRGSSRARAWPINSLRGSPRPTRAPRPPTHPSPADAGTGSL